VKGFVFTSNPDTFRRSATCEKDAEISGYTWVGIAKDEEEAQRPKP
jgi:hypothetical protein